MYPKNHENFEKSKPRFQFYWFLLKKRSVATVAMPPLIMTSNFKQQAPLILVKKIQLIHHPNLNFSKMVNIQL